MSSAMRRSLDITYPESDPARYSEVAEVAACALAGFAEEIDVGDEFPAVVDPQCADVGDQPRAANHHLHLAADLA